tara:strand:+ start:79 stop:1392 length:1314 start_codon:yes stop_codon:yes gene_type:complete
MNVIIPVETASREMPYKVHLCNFLAYNGFSCYLGHKAYTRYLVEKMRNFIYLDKGYHKGKSKKLYNQVKNNNGIVISLDEEGGIDYEDNSTLLNVRYPKEMLDNVDYAFLWGKHQYNLLTNNVKNKNKLYVTGHPRFTLLKEPYHLLYEEEVNQIKDNFGDFVLINTNMGYGNNIRGHEFIINNYGKKFSDIHGMAEYSKSKVKNFISLAREISTKLNKKIIIRPHPEEDSSTYSEAFLDNKFIHVLSEGSVIPWILASNVMIHADCTTAIESVFLGRKPISFVQDHNPKYVTKVPVEVSTQYNKIEDVVEHIRALPNTLDSINEKDLSYLENYFSHSQDSFRAVTARIKMIGSKANTTSISGLSVRDKLVLNFKALKLKLDIILGRNKLSESKLATFNNFEIKKMHSYSKEINNEFRGNSVTKVVEQLFLFENCTN